MGIVIAVLVFEFMILIHEWGHYIAARKNGVFVQEFALGMGPKIVGWTSKKTGTLYSWRIFPIGGYCQMLGEDEKVERKDSFSAKFIGARIMIVAAGPFMNIAMAFLLNLILIVANGYSTTVIQSLDKGYGAMDAGIEAGDQITAVNGQRVHILQDVNYALIDNMDQPMEVTVRKPDGSEKTVTVIPQYDDALERYRLGISVGGYAQGWGGAIAEKGAGVIPELIGNTFAQAFWQMTGNIKLVIRSFVQLITGQMGLDSLMGPIGIVNVVGDSYAAAATVNLWAALSNVLSLTALLSVNMGVMNLFPIPALDGSRIIFLAIEGVRKKPLSQKLEAGIYTAGFVLLMALMAFVAYQDIVRLFA